MRDLLGYKPSLRFLGCDYKGWTEDHPCDNIPLRESVACLEKHNHTVFYVGRDLKK